MTTNNPKNNPKPKSTLKHIAALSGIGIQMGVIIYLFAKLGLWLDTTYNDNQKLYVVICTLIGVAVSFYLVLKQLNKLNQ